MGRLRAKKGKKNMIKTMQAVINGQTYDLTLDASGRWTATVTAPAKSSYGQSGHCYGVKITAEDEAGNAATVDETHATLGAALKLRVKEKTAPVITILSPSAGAFLATATPEITFKITDNDSGVDLDSVTVKMDGKALTGVTHEAVTGGYSFAVTSGSLTDGQHTITVDAADHDGNAAAQASVSFKTDTVPPVLNVTAPADGLKTNSTKVTVGGVTNDVTSSPVTLKVNGSAVTVNADGSWSTQVDLAEGENTITVVATDAAGKSSTVVRTVTLDTAAPVFVSVTLTPNPVDAGATFVLTVEATDE